MVGLQHVKAVKIPVSTGKQESVCVTRASIATVLALSAALDYCTAVSLDDQDNTLTAPYEDTVHPLVEVGLKRCMEVFEGSVCIMSNSAGTRYATCDVSAVLSLWFGRIAMTMKTFTVVKSASPPIGGWHWHNSKNSV